MIKIKNPFKIESFHLRSTSEDIYVFLTPKKNLHYILPILKCTYGFTPEELQEVIDGIYVRGNTFRVTRISKHREGYITTGGATFSDSTCDKELLHKALGLYCTLGTKLIQESVETFGQFEVNYD